MGKIYSSFNLSYVMNDINKYLHSQKVFVTAIHQLHSDINFKICYPHLVRSVQTQK